MGVSASQNGIHLTLLCNFTLSIGYFTNTDNSLTSHQQYLGSTGLKEYAMCDGMCKARKEMGLMMVVISEVLVGVFDCLCWCW